MSWDERATPRESNLGSGRFSLSRWRTPAIAVAALVLVGLVSILWYVTTWQGGLVSDGGLPVVQAPQGPIKERPTDPGGWEVPHQDKLVLNRDLADGKPRIAERLLPPPEEPRSVEDILRDEGGPAAEAMASTEAEPLPTTEEAYTGALPFDPQLPPRLRVDEAELQAARGEEPTPAGEEDAQVVGEEDDQVAEILAQLAARSEEDAAATPEAPSGEVTGAVTPGGEEIMVQLASLKTQDAAQATWLRVQDRYAALLGGVQGRVERADLGERGIYYRVQAGPFPSRETAAEVCRQLKAQGQNCLITTSAQGADNG
jgi:cell division septation protein DedD